jgi:hypothetical protein
MDIKIVGSQAHGSKILQFPKKINEHNAKNYARLLYPYVYTMNLSLYACECPWVPWREQGIPPPDFMPRSFDWSLFPSGFATKTLPALLSHACCMSSHYFIPLRSKCSQHPDLTFSLHSPLL